MIVYWRGGIKWLVRSIKNYALPVKSAYIVQVYRCEQIPQQKTVSLQQRLLVLELLTTDDLPSSVTDPSCINCRLELDSSRSHGCRLNSPRRN